METHKKALVYLILTLALATFACADEITTPINISTSNGVVNIQTEKWNNQYHCNTTSTNNLLLTIQRDLETEVPCSEIIDNLTTALHTMEDSYKDSKSYAPLYTACFSNLTNCKLDKEVLINKSVFQEKYETCATEKTGKESALLECVNTKAIAEGERNNCIEERDDAKTDRYVWAVIAGIIGGAVTWVLTRKPWIAKTEVESIPE